MDGALGAGTAVMFEAFSDDPGNTGVYAAEAIPLSKIEERIAGADAAGLQVEVHAIGDKAIAELFDIFARVAKKNGAEGPPLPHRARPAHAPRPRSRASPSRASSPRCSRTTPSTTGAGPIGGWAERDRSLGTYAFRWLLDEKATSGLRLRLGRRAALADPGDRRCRHARDDRRQAAGRLGARAEDHGRGGPARLHVMRRLRGVRGEGKGLARDREARGFRSSLGDVLAVRPEAIEKIQVDTDGRRRPGRLSALAARRRPCAAFSRSSASRCPRRPPPTSSARSASSSVSRRAAATRSRRSSTGSTCRPGSAHGTIDRRGRTGRSRT